jgi:hypothetical protein
VLLRTFAGLLGLSGCGDCPENDHVYLLRETYPELAVLIEACEGPMRSCQPLCERLLLDDPDRRGVARATHCELHRDNAGYTQVNVRWPGSCEP